MKLYSSVHPLRWEPGALHLLDQRRLPAEQVWLRCATAGDVARAIADMVVRGAPVIGVSAAFGLALEARALDAGREPAAWLTGLERAGAVLEAARPTAVNLAWAVRKMLDRAREVAARPDRVAAMEAAAQALYDEDAALCEAMGRAGAELLADGSGVLTHCNAGALATCGIGTATGLLRAARAEGKRLKVYATETRPYLQGARLTAWELLQDGFDVTLLCDSAAAGLLASGRVQAVVVGADRIAANGDVANKVGTYALALAAARHGVPLYVAAPTSTLDPHTPSGAAIPIEERAAEEVTHCGGRRVAAEGVRVWNPAFDVTPAELVAAIVTEHGVHRPPYSKTLPL